MSNLNRRRGLSVSDELSTIDNILKRKKGMQLLYVVFRVLRANANPGADLPLASLIETRYRLPI